MIKEKDEMIDRLLNYGFLTGSRAFRTEQIGSDWDIVYCVVDSVPVNEIIDGYEKTFSEYFSGYYISVGNDKINLIPVSPFEYLPWFLATKSVRETLVISGIDNPIKKYSLFMGIVSFFKGMIDHTSKSFGNLGEEVNSDIQTFNSVCVKEAIERQNLLDCKLITFFSRLGMSV